MVEASTGANPAGSSGNPAAAASTYTYDQWMRSVGLPVHTGYFIPDLRTAELGWWEDRGCQCAFIQLMGQEGIIEARISEIPPGETLPALKLSVDEVVYVVQGRGLTSVGDANGSGSKTVEWDKHSMFLLPRNQAHQFSNTSGIEAARLLHYNYLPLAMTTIPDPEFFFNNPYDAPESLTQGGNDFYSEARGESRQDGVGLSRYLWYGNFFPDLRSWDRLEANTVRGAGGHSVYMQFPGSEMSSHMSVFAPRLYKKAHRHGPGRVIVIPNGEGFSILWEEGKEKIVVPWQEASAFVPPNRWFHQHFNVGGARARYLALHPPKQFHGYTDEQVGDLSNDQIEYADEQPWIRETFEKELAKRELTSLMPDEAYKYRDYQWDYRSAAG
ncbi:MAG: cupin domain-containing protein [Dehalococcoidia bacterium]